MYTYLKTLMGTSYKIGYVKLYIQKKMYPAYPTWSEIEDYHL